MVRQEGACRGRRSTRHLQLLAALGNAGRCGFLSHFHPAQQGLEQRRVVGIAPVAVFAGIDKDLHQPVTAPGRGHALAQRAPLVAERSLDFSLDINCSQVPEAFLFARNRIVLASRTADLPSPIDGVTPAISDLAVVAQDSQYARSLGFGAKLCIHPGQLATVQSAFLPDSRQLAWADRVMRAVATGSHAVQVDGEMVDLPLIEHAQRLLDVASQHAPLARADAC